jgi:hypothetical protein
MLAPPGIARIVSLLHVERWMIGGAVTCEEFARVGGVVEGVFVLGADGSYDEGPIEVGGAIDGEPE